MGMEISFPRFNYRFISALYGKRISFDCTGSVSRSSPWNCIIRELGSLFSKGINLLALLKKKVGNGAHTFFWEDTWINDTPLSRTFPRFLAGESCSHLFFSCSLARLLWTKVARWWDFDIPDFSAYEEWITWFKTIRLPKVVKEVLEGVFYVM
nr:RNA-directed DNA polymerase, eukaryota [Tanacetum cinerariifolium]